MSIVMDTGSEWVKGVVHLLTLMLFQISSVQHKRRYFEKCFCFL